MALAIRGGRGDEEDEEFNGYSLRDAIYEKYGKCFDVDFNYMRKRAFWDEPLPDLTDTLFKV